MKTATRVQEKKQPVQKACSKPVATTRTKQATHDEISKRAYELWLQRDCAPGHDLDDWKQAEQELR